MAERSWQFHTIARQLGAAVRYEWRWRARSADGTTTESQRSFLSLTECVEDARREGFTGEADPTRGFGVTRGGERGLSVRDAGEDDTSAP